jgi:hypothetical protein
MAVDFKAYQARRAASGGGFGGNSRRERTPKMDYKAQVPAVFRLNGYQDSEPYLYPSHTIQQPSKFPGGYPRRVYVPCADAQCVPCYTREHKEESAYAEVAERVGGVADRVAWNVVDYRFRHTAPKIDRQKTDRSGRPNPNYGKVVMSRSGPNAGKPFIVEQFCTGKGCRWCGDKNPEYAKKEPVGFCIFEVASMFNDQFMLKGAEIAEFCACCWRRDPDTGDPVGGRIEAVAWVCPTEGCGTEIALGDYEPWPDGAEAKMTHHCDQCGQDVYPTEVVVCSENCENARRTSMFDGKWRMIWRTMPGTKTATAEFQFLGVSDPDTFFEGFAPKVLEEEYQPIPARASAKWLGVPNPFAQGGVKGAQQAVQRGGASSGFGGKFGGGTKKPPVEEPATDYTDDGFGDFEQQSFDEESVFGG